MTKATPNANNPMADVAFIIEELSDLFGSAEAAGRSHIHLNSAVGSKFHARVKNAAKYLDAARTEPDYGPEVLGIERGEE